LSQSSEIAPSGSAEKEFDALSRYLPHFWNVTQSQAAFLVCEIYSHVAKQRPFLFYTHPITEMLALSREIRQRNLRKNYPHLVTDEHLYGADSLSRQLGFLLSNVDTFYASTMANVDGKLPIADDRSHYIDSLEAGVTIPWYRLLEQRSSCHIDFFERSQVSGSSIDFSYSGNHYVPHKAADSKDKMALFESLVSKVWSSNRKRDISDRHLLAHCIYDYCTAIVSLVNTEEMEMGLMYALNAKVSNEIHSQVFYGFTHSLLKVFDEQSIVFDLLFAGVLGDEHIEMLKNVYGNGFFDSFIDISADFTKGQPQKADTPIHRRLRLELTERGFSKGLSALENGRVVMTGELFDILKINRVCHVQMASG